MQKHKTIINIHAKHYITDVFEKRLHEEGFVCPDDKLLCWYRMHGENIVNSLIFFSPWSNLPLMMFVGYGIHPLFSEPVISRNVHFTKRPIYDDRFIEQGIVENVPINSMGYSMYSPDIAVAAPSHAGKGIYTLDGIILPNMEKIQSIEDAYRFHKDRRLSYEKTHLQKINGSCVPLSKCFIDMALYLGDEAVYSDCAKQAAKYTQWYSDAVQTHPTNRELAKLLKEWAEVDAVFTKGNTEEYRSVLHKREQVNAALLRRRLALDV